MVIDLVLSNAKIYTSSGIVTAGVAIENGRILRIAKEANLPQASHTLDLHGHLVLPGLVDMHVHLRDQQLAYKEDFVTGTSAAAAGGVTLIADMPNNIPPTTSATSLRERARLAENHIFVNTAFYSAFPEDLAQLPSIVKEKAIGFKVFLSNEIRGFDTEDNNLLTRAFTQAANLNIPVAIHAEDKKTLENAEQEVKKTCRTDVKAHLETHPAIAEMKAIQRIVQLFENTGGSLHLCHLSSAIGLTSFLAAKKQGLRITCEVTPHHLLLSNKHSKRLPRLTLVHPPIRTLEDTKALWNAVTNRQVDSIASDHAPHTIEEKTTESIWDVKPGIPGLETTLPLLLNEVNKGHLTVPDLVRMTSEVPARILKLKDRGSFKAGCYADLVVIDMKQKHEIDASRFHSKAKYSPFNGWKVKGKPIRTFVNGRLVMDEGEIVAKAGTGSIVS